MYHLECIRCGAKYGPNEVIYTCGKCGGLLDVVYDYSQIRLTRDDLKGPLSVWKYKALLPISREPVTLKEGGTPVYNIRAIGKDIGMKDAHVKHEGMNPSGSFKDRGMTVGVTKALELGMKSVACASTGNTSASLAVYGARAGIPVIVLLPAGKVALGKVAQALMHGSKVLSIRGNFDDALRLVREMCIEQGIYLLNSINPYRLEGQKTIGFEIVDYFGWEVPDRIILPVGNAGNITAILQRAQRDEEARAHRPHTEDDRHSGRGQRAHREGHPERRKGHRPRDASRNCGDCHPHRRPGECNQGIERYPRFRRSGGNRDRRRNPESHRSFWRSKKASASSQHPLHRSQA